jgi:hypothetical protein
MIIIDRDPRDIFETMTNEKRLLGADVKISADKYILWHKAAREKFNFEKHKKSPNINLLELRFEDFFIDYKNTISKLIEFLEIDYFHNEKGTKFNPNLMTDYVGIWKKNKNQKIMEKIHNELPKSCFNY